MKRKLFLALLSFSITCGSFSQAAVSDNDLSAKHQPKQFYFSYLFSGLGSNMGRFAPNISVNGSSLLYSNTQNSYSGKQDPRIDTICQARIRQGSIDSILFLVRNLKDSTITKYNFCMMSGGIHSMTVTDGTDTTNFYLSNTFDYTALKIVRIVNAYLPADKPIWADEKMIEDSDTCFSELFGDKKGKVKRGLKKKRQ
jgi:hypothetical protein